MTHICHVQHYIHDNTSITVICLAICIHFYYYSYPISWPLFRLNSNSCESISSVRCYVIFVIINTPYSRRCWVISHSFFCAFVRGYIVHYALDCILNFDTYVWVMARYVYLYTRGIIARTEQRWPWYPFRYCVCEFSFLIRTFKKSPKLSIFFKIIIFWNNLLIECFESCL